MILYPGAPRLFFPGENHSKLSANLDHTTSDCDYPPLRVLSGSWISPSRNRIIYTLGRDGRGPSLPTHVFQFQCLAKGMDSELYSTCYVRIVVGYWNNMWIQGRRTIVLYIYIYIRRCSELDCGQWGVLDCCTLRYPAMGTCLDLPVSSTRDTHGRSEQGQTDRQTDRQTPFFICENSPMFLVQLGNNPQDATADRLKVFFSPWVMCRANVTRAWRQMWNIYIFLKTIRWPSRLQWNCSFYLHLRTYLLPQQTLTIYTYVVLIYK